MCDETSLPRRRLRIVGAESTADRRAAVARWVMTLGEPLLSTDQRVEADRQFAAFVGRNSQWAAYWFAGVLHDVLATLPSDDPWRHLSASVDLTAMSLGEPGSDEESTATFRAPEGAEPPAGTGAVLPDGRQFGSVHDSDDLVPAGMSDPDTDVGLVGLVEPLSDLAAAVTGFASAGAEALATVIGKIYHHLWLAEFSGEAEATAGEALFDACGAALRRAIHRRRIYTGLDDPYPSVVGFAWMARADRLMGGSRSISAELGMARDAAIDPTAYRDMKIN